MADQDAEQLIITALRKGDCNSADKLLAKLQRLAPDSVRVQRISAKVAGAKGDIDNALNICRDILLTDPADLLTWKTLISLERGSGRWTDAISSLNEVLDMVPSDTSSWRELSDLYMRQRQFAYAAYAMEEIILLQPACYGSYLTYAELLAADKRSMDQARHYYAMSIELNPNHNARALYGLIKITRDSTNKKALAGELHEWALVRLLDLYRDRAPHLAKFPQSFAIR
uniref:ER membrane protein complex subunit 2 n=1 Tax=Spongospora subterranea TaxID=70186 RepID=A0A0H5QGM3_9EUKA|eukprot:CRZ00752.1 hypothetical protein [Spongospora subterranea]